MCGITGIANLAGEKPIERSILERMNDSIFHRGPDSGGAYIEEGRVGIAARRLAIIDVAGGDQPIASEHGSSRIVFNGEIYNFQELRDELEQRGHHFRTRSDTEVVVQAYEEFGDACVERLRGMFSFAIWDLRRQRLLVARDRVGEKQIYYTVVGNQLLFGSELKCVLAHPSVSRRLRPSAVNHFLTWLYVPEPLTMFEDIHELPTGHTLVVENGRIDLRRYWSLRYDVDESLSAEDAARGLRERLEVSVRERLISDVPLGAFLSGGIDSGSIVALMARHSDAAVNTFSIGYDFGGDAFDERVYARELADKYGTTHRELVVHPDLADVTPRLVRAFDQPNADASAIPTWYLAEFTRQHVTVALSGIGGDEMAAGYERHRGALVGERLRWISRFGGTALLQAVARRLPDARSGDPWSERVKRFVHHLDLPFDERYFAFLSALDPEARASLLTPEMLEQIALDEPRDHFRAIVDEVGSAAPLNRVLYADLRLFLPSNLLTLTDRMSMAHSLEVRAPFIDHELLEYAATIPPRWKIRGIERKHVLKRAVHDLLPPDFLKRRKMGFSLPLGVWFRGPLREFAEDTLNEDAIRRSGVFRYEGVRKLLDEHYARRANHDNRIWALIVFMTWWRDYLEQQSPPSRACSAAP